MNAHIANSRISYSLGHPVVKAGAVACLVGAAVLMAATLVWWHAHGSNLELEERLAAERRALVEARQAEELARVYARNLHAVPQLERKLAAAVDQTQIVDGLGHLAREHGIRILNQSYAERRDKANGGGLVVELAVEGPYGAVRNFIQGLSTLPVWIELHEVQLDRTADAGGVKGRLRMISFRGRGA
jgi:Tfp pilus assembly protein PilO